MNIGGNNQTFLFSYKETIVSISNISDNRIIPIIRTDC